MKRRRKNGWSLLVMRGADRTVKQFHVSKRSVVAAPAAAVLAIAGCIGGLQLRSAFLIHELESRLAEQAVTSGLTIEAKEGKIVSLQEEISLLSRQTEQMKLQLEELHELEAKLQQFIETYEGIVEKEALLPAPLNNDREVIRLAQEGGVQFSQLSTLVDAMEDSMAQSIRLARTRQAELQAKPTEWPTASSKLTSGFGYRKDPFTGRAAFHAGIDIAGKTGDPIFAAADGTVLETGFDAARGNYIFLTHRDNLKTYYLHLKSIEVQAGETVVQGEKIGTLGSTGRSTGAHLHFQIMQSDEPINPLKYLNSNGKD